MKTKFTLLLGALVAVCSLSSCTVYPATYGGYSGYGRSHCNGGYRSYGGPLFISSSYYGSPGYRSCATPSYRSCASPVRSSVFLPSPPVFSHAHYSSPRSSFGSFGMPSMPHHGGFPGGGFTGGHHGGHHFY